MIKIKIKGKTSSKKYNIPRGISHSSSKEKMTVGVYLPKNLVERARNRRLNLSRVTEQALSSILDYLEPQNNQKTRFLGKASFGKEVLVDGTGFEPAASTMPTWRSYQADLPAQQSVLMNSNPQY